MSAIGELPERAMRSGLLWLSRQPRLGRFATRTTVTRSMVDRFVAGQTLPEALAVLGRLREHGFVTTVDVLGESVTSMEAAEAASGRYLETIDALAAGSLERNVSVKLSQMGLDVDEKLCRQNVGRIFERAAASSTFVRIDMEDHAKTDATLGIWRDLRSLNPASGVVIQAALRRSPDDVAALIAERAPIRLCKGAYKEPAAVAHQARAEVDAAYVRLMERLLREGERPALATHDERIVERAIALVERESLGRERFEFQMLYGIRRDLQARLSEAGYRVRIYVPYGREWYPYFMRRLAERPANVAFVLRAVLHEGKVEP